MNAALARFGARRAVSAWFLCALCAWLAFLLGAIDWAPPQLEVAATASGSLLPDALARALRRQGVWSAWLLVAAPLSAVRAAELGAAARGRDASWLRTSTAGAAQTTLAVFAGFLAATLALLMLAGAALELTTAAEGAQERFVGRLAHPAVVLDARSTSAELLLELPEPPPTSSGSTGPERARLRASWRALGPSRGALRWRLARGGATTVAERELGYHARLGIDVPPGTGTVRCTFDWQGEAGAFLLAADGLELFAREDAGRAASLAIGARAAWLLLAWTALAFGLATWMSPNLAVLLAGALQLAIWLADSGPRLLPGRDFIAALAWVGGGRLPERLDLVSCAGAVLTASVGLALGVLAAWTRRSG